MQQGVDNCNETGVFTWRVTEFSAKREDLRWRSQSYLFSESFPVGHKNLRMRVRLYPNGLGEAHGSHVSVLLEFVQPGTSGEQQLPSEKISSLSPPTPPSLPLRPFYHRRTVTLLDQSERNRRKDVVWSEEPSAKATWPLDCMLEPHGPLKLVSHQQLDKDNVYLRDDTLCVRVSIEPRDDLMNIYFAADGKLKPSTKKGSLDKPLIPELQYTDC